MKNIISKFLLACMLLLGVGFNFSAHAQKQSFKTVKVISWNIWNGFGSNPNKNCLNDFVRFIQKENPDVLGLVELCNYNHEKLAELASRYGHPYVAILTGDSHPVAITSKKPLKEVFKQIDGFGHGMLHCHIDGIDYLVTHLTPGDKEPARRAKRKVEADNLVNYIRENKLDSCVLLGDLNSVSPFDAQVADRDLGQYTCISTLMGASLHDICYLFNSDKDRCTFPTQAKRFSQDPVIIRYPQQRLDYIFVTDALFPNCIEGKIYRGNEVELISDHGPIGITMYFPL